MGPSSSTRNVAVEKPIRTLIGKLVDLRDGELAPLLWATAYGFLIFFSYYILRAVRDEISAADRGNLQLLWTGTFFVMLGAVALYSWVASRYQRGVFVPLTNRFFLLNLVGFWLALQLLSPAARPWIDRAFYVWAAVFALFVVTVFWGFLADCFTNDQGKRLFAFIAVGSSIGGIAGSAVTAVLAEAVPPFTLLLVACVPLEAASWCVAVLHRRFGGEGGRRRRRAGPAAAAAPAAESGARDRPAGAGRETADRPLGGSAWSGIGVVFRSPYLLGIAAFLLLMTFASTVLYFQQAHLLGEAITDRGARTALLARMDLAANALTILLQTYVAARIIRRFGIGWSLALIPAATVVGFVILGLYPTLAVLIVVQVLYRAGRYGLAKPAREVLFTVVGREEKYKSKAFLDAAVYRGGDLASAWAYAGLAAVGLTVGAIALVAAPLAVVWVGVGFVLGRGHDERAARSPRPGEPAPEPAPA